MAWNKQVEALHWALEAVRVNGQAVAAADLALGTVSSLRDQLSPWSIDPARRKWRTKLDGAITDINRYRGPFVGLPGAEVNQSSWDDLRHAIQRAYNQMWSIQEQVGDDGELQALAGFVFEVVAGSVAAMPDVIRSAVGFTAELATDTVGAIAEGVLPLWPIVVVVSVVAVAGAAALLLAKKKGLA